MTSARWRWESGRISHSGASSGPRNCVTAWARIRAPAWRIEEDSERPWRFPSNRECDSLDFDSPWRRSTFAALRRHRWRRCCLNTVKLTPHGLVAGIKDLVTLPEVALRIARMVD